MGRKRISIRLLSALILLSIFFNFNLVEVYASNVNTELRNKLVHIETTKAGNGFEDLQSLKEIVKDKNIIGLGESTRGAREFYEMKHRMIEYLVEELDYRAIAIDKEFADVKVVNDYIQNGESTLDEAIWALRNYNWAPTREDDGRSEIVAHAYLASWTTTELTDMLNWMKDYNEKLPGEDKIRFYGINIELPEKSIDDLFAYLDIVDVTTADQYRNRLSDLAIIHGFKIKYPTSRPLGLFIGMMEELEKSFKENKDVYIDMTSEVEYALAEQDLNIIFQWINYSDTNLQTGTTDALHLREYYMSENIKWILEFEKTLGNNKGKILIWGHNESIAKKSNFLKTMGEYLKEIYGDDYYTIGMDFYEGRFRAFGVDIWGNPMSNYLAKFNIKSSPKKTLVYELEKTGIPISFLDFQTSLDNEKINNFLSSQQAIHNIGIMYPGKYAPHRYLVDVLKRYSNIIPKDTYDGFVFIKEITETTGVYDGRDTRVENGDKELISHYFHIVFGQISTIISIVLVVVLVIFLIRRKIRQRQEGRGARYPSSDRWG